MENFTIHIVDYNSESYYFEIFADASLFMDTAMKLERDDGNEEWDISCAIRSEDCEADTWSNAFTKLQFSYLEGN